MFKKILGFAALAALTASPLTAQQQPKSPKGKAPVVITVMTQNMFEGTNLGLVRKAQTEDQFKAAVQATLTEIDNTQPKARAAAMARMIARQKPDLVGLQEASLVETIAGPNPTPRWNLRDDLIAALAASGHSYRVVKTVDGLNAGGPTPAGFGVRLLRRTAIIAKVTGDLVIVSNSDKAGIFNAQYVAHTGTGAAIPVNRGWVSVDVKIHGRTLRFITTHLEYDDPQVQSQQATELIQLLPANMPVIVVGDFNGPPILTRAGVTLRDVWANKGGGATCCHAPDKMTDRRSPLTQRVDLVLHGGGFTVQHAELVGTRWGEWGSLNSWPSDHAGVLATLRID